MTLSISACVTGPDVLSDYDRKADFAAYRTFAFMSPLGTDRAGYATLLTERLKSATLLQMEQKGYRYDPENPDLLINFQVRTQDRAEFVPAPPMPWGPNYYGYQMGWYSAWPGYGISPEVIRYTESIVSIDLIDAGRKQLVWEGVAKSVTDDPMQAASASSLNVLVAKIFLHYPFVAGSVTLPVQKL